MKLHGIPEAIAAGVLPLSVDFRPCDAAITAIQWGYRMARVELLDEISAAGLQRLLQARPCREEPMLFLEFHGSRPALPSNRNVSAISSRFCGSHSNGRQGQDRARLWQVRHDVAWAGPAIPTGADLVVTDVCVPISGSLSARFETKRDIEASRLVAPIVGHVGDGNFQGLAPGDHRKTLTRSRAPRPSSKNCGTRTCYKHLHRGHGIGQGKKRFLMSEHGDAAVGAMRAIKHALDPAGIMFQANSFRRNIIRPTNLKAASLTSPMCPGLCLKGNEDGRGETWPRYDLR